MNFPLLCIQESSVKNHFFLPFIFASSSLLLGRMKKSFLCFESSNNLKNYNLSSFCWGKDLISSCSCSQFFLRQSLFELPLSEESLHLRDDISQWVRLNEMKTFEILDGKCFHFKLHSIFHVVSFVKWRKNAKTLLSSRKDKVLIKTYDVLASYVTLSLQKWLIRKN